jgi:hypothetical protein
MAVLHMAIARTIRTFCIPLERWLYTIALSQFAPVAGADVLSAMAIAIKLADLPLALDLRQGFNLNYATLNRFYLKLKPI